MNEKLNKVLNQKINIDFDYKNHIKEQENLRLKIENEEQQKLTEMQRKNDRALYELKQNIERAKIDKEQDEIKANTTMEVQLQKAK
jgi:hypothetical protein